MSIGKRIKELIDAKNMSVKEFAESIDMSYANLHAYISDKREPGSIVLKRLYEVGGDLNYIVMGERKNVIKEVESRLIKYEKLLSSYKIYKIDELEVFLKKYNQIKKTICD